VNSGALSTVHMPREQRRCSEEKEEEGTGEREEG